MGSLSALPSWFQVEHEVAQLLTDTEIHGWYFNSRSAQQLTSSLQKELEETYPVLRNRYPFVKE